MSCLATIGRSSAAAFWRPVRCRAYTTMAKQIFGSNHHFTGGIASINQKSVRTISTDEEGLLVEKKNKVVTVTFNRPKRYNAITAKMYDDIGRILNEAAKDDDVSLVKMTGTGKYYSSGNDLKDMAKIFTPDKLEEKAREAADLVERFVSAYINFPKPLIAAVNGPAVGIVVSTLGLFDAVYASEAATFCTPFAKIGQSPEACSSYTFPKIMGNVKATDMLCFGRTVSAAEACNSSLVTEVFPPSTFERDVDEKIEKILQLPLKSIVYTKELIRKPEKEVLHSVNKMECERLIERWTSVDCLNAVMKFAMNSQS